MISFVEVVVLGLKNIECKNICMCYFEFVFILVNWNEFWYYCKIIFLSINYVIYLFLEMLLFKFWFYICFLYFD